MAVASNPDQYLQRVGGTYYARVRVPRTLEKLVGQTHLRVSLKTGERSEANRRKHEVVGRLKAGLQRLRQAPKGTEEPGISFADAKEWREQLQSLEAAGDHEQAEVITSVAVDKAEQLEALYGHQKALKWFRAATVTADTLTDLMDRWLSISDYRESTKAGHRKALAEVLSFIGNEHAVPGDVTRKLAMRYIDADLTQRGLAHSTMRDRLVSLGGFWNWLESRGEVLQGQNPWTGHKLSKKQNPGRGPAKRAYSDAELLALLQGTPETKGWPTYSYLPDLMVLGMFTGAREEELCCLRPGDIEVAKGVAVIHITDAKTKAGIRYVGVTHPAPLAVLKRRMKKSPERLFMELSPGGKDHKYSSSAVKAFGRYRRACGVPDGTDFHSFRRNVITVLEAARVGQVEIARYVGHKVGTMAGDVYSAGGSKSLAIQVGHKIRFADTSETAAIKLVQR
jgi:integrase